MTTPPNANAVSDARLARLADTIGDLLGSNPGDKFAPDAVAALRELQARRAADAAREAALLQADAKLAGYENEYIRPCFGWAREIGVDLSQMVIDNPGHNCVALLVRHLIDAAKPREPAPGVVEALRALLAECNEAGVPSSIWRWIADATVRSLRKAMDDAAAALAAHDARQPQRDPVQAVLAEVAALVPVENIHLLRSDPDLRDFMVSKAAGAVAYVLRLDREAREKGATT